MKEKMYPFSCKKHAHDIEFYANRLYNTMCDMESGEIPMDKERYDWMYDLYYGELMELRDAVCYNTRDGVVSYLTGNQIALAKKIVFWASEERANTCIKNGRYDLLQYC